MAKKLTNAKEKQIFIKAFQARRWLNVHGFFTYQENKKMLDRLDKYQDKHKIEVTEKELDK